MTRRRLDVDLDAAAVNYEPKNAWLRTDLEQEARDRMAIADSPWFQLGLEIMCFKYEVRKALWPLFRPILDTVARWLR